MGSVRNFLGVLGALSAFAGLHVNAQEEAVMEEIIVEAPYDFRLEPPRESSVQILLERLTLKSETERALELQTANRTPLNTVLDLTKYSPIRLGASLSRADEFFRENYMRADLNPREADPLALRR